jgi:phasin family protein
MLRCTLYVALQQTQQFRGIFTMADTNQTQAQAAADAPATIAKAVADTTEKVVAETKRVAKNERAKTVRRVKSTRRAKAATKAAATRRAKTATRKNAAAAKAATRTIRNSATPNRAAQDRTISMINNDFFKGFEALPTFAPFQNMFAQTNDKGQQFAQRGQKVAEELADLTRANVEAVVKAGRVASEGARALTQDAVATSREGFEQAADAIRTLAEAKSPTEYLQVQGEFARASFDRFVAEGSKMAESMVKLAGEAFQPISNRATANAERFNTLVA